MEFTAEQQAYIDGLTKKASEDAVTKFKTDAEAERQKAIPAKYELKFGDKSKLDPTTDAEKIAAYARKQGFTAEQASELVQHMEEIAGGLTTRTEQQQRQQRDDWNKSLQADKELGGDNFKNTTANVKRAMDWLGKQIPTAKFVEFAEETGFGSHPAVVAAFNALGKAMAEDKPTGRFLGGGGDVPPDHEIVYGAKK